MKLRMLGKSGLKVSEISLGSWLSLGGKQNEHVPGSPVLENKEKGLEILSVAIDSGVNFFDTAPGYGYGNAEKMIGTFLKQHDRDNFVLATKVFFPFIQNYQRFGTSKKSIHVNLKDSLSRLNTDYIDLYYRHQYDYFGNIEETIRAMNDAIDQGKILYWGVSNWTAAEIERVYGICKAQGYRPPIADQDKYNLIDRRLELSHSSTYEYTGIQLTSYSPLEMGILTGKYNRQIPEDSRLKKAESSAFGKMFAEEYNEILTDDLRAKLIKLEEIAKDHDLSLSQLSLAWALSKNFVGSLIVGASSPHQVKENALASEVNLNSDVITQIELIMDNKPMPHGPHKNWNYQKVHEILKTNNYRIKSLQQQEEKK